MSEDKYPSIFLQQLEIIVLITLQLFFATRAVLKIGKYPRITDIFVFLLFLFCFLFLLKGCFRVVAD